MIKYEIDELDEKMDQLEDLLDDAQLDYDFVNDVMTAQEYEIGINLTGNEDVDGARRDALMAFVEDFIKEYGGQIIYYGYNGDKYIIGFGSFSNWDETWDEAWGYAFNSFRAKYLGQTMSNTKTFNLHWVSETIDQLVSELGEYASREPEINAALESCLAAKRLVMAYSKRMLDTPHK